MTSAPPAPGLVCTKSRVRRRAQQSSQPGTVCKLMSYPCLWLGKSRNTCHNRNKQTDRQTDRQTNNSKQLLFLLSPSCTRTDPTGKDLNDTPILCLISLEATPTSRAGTSSIRRHPSPFQKSRRRTGVPWREECLTR